MERVQSADQPAPQRRITSWPSSERPQERLLRTGPSALTDAELLALLLRTGSRGRNAVDLALSVLAHAGSLRGLGRLSLFDLLSLHGVGRAKAAGIVAAVELGRRIQAAGDDATLVLRTPADVARRMIPALRDRGQEVFVVLILDAKNALQAEVEISRGTLTASLVHPREVFRAAIERRAASIIVVHNHPSGNPEPSIEDMEITRQLAETGRVIGIPLHDHVIVAGATYTSLAERGLL